MDPLRDVDFGKGGGLVVAIAQDAGTGEILMIAHMNEESLRRTLETGQVHYWSRTRGLWHKGESSGNVQELKGLFVDCDGDAILLQVEQRGGAACHTGKRSCFFRKLEASGGERNWLDVGVQVFDPEQVYGR
jgi:phosphoribosyl-AMP cyclohydrolase